MKPGRATILVADDRAVNRDLFRQILEFDDHEVIEAGDGARALAEVRERHPDLVIADILMPVMDGYEFVRRLRAEPGIADTRVMFCTASYHEPGARDLASLCGVQHVLTKPVEPETLLATVRATLGQAPKRQGRRVRPGFEHAHLRLVTDKLSDLDIELGKANDRLAALIGINLQMASERDPRRLLDELCRTARELVGARFALLVAGTRDTDDTLYFATAGMDAETVAALGMPGRTGGVLSKACAERRAVRAVNPGGDPRAVGLPERFPRVHTLLAAPIVSPRHVYGCICLAERIGVDGFGDEDEKLLSILAAQVGRIYENGSLYADVRESEERFRQLAENIREVFYLYDFDTKRLLYVNPAYEEIWGRSVASLYEDPRSWMDAIHPQDVADVENARSRMQASGTYDVQYRVVRPNGSMRWIHDRGYPLRDQSGAVSRIAGLAEDFTARKEAEIHIRRLNRVYAMLSGINTLIVRVHERGKLFDGVCRIAVELGKFGMVWIGLVDRGSNQIRSVSQYGFDNDAYKDLAFPMTVTPGGENWGPAWEALARCQAVVDNDIVARPDLNCLRRAAVDAGYKSMAVLPLLAGSTPLGVLFIYAKEAAFFNDDEMQLLNELAADISFALEYIGKEEKIEFLAYHDPLTGLANRALLHRRLTEVLESAKLHAGSSALILLNINKFHDINNSLGHHNGDLLLKAFAQRLQEVVWHSDVVSHLGGDEFALLLPRLASSEHIDLVVRKILETMAGQFNVDRLPVVLEVRMGSAVAPGQADSADLLWQRASIALRAARELHSPHVNYNSSIDHYDPQRLALIGGFRKSIDANELVLHYQPKIDLQRRIVSGVEALVRWQHPERGLVFPDQFLPLVEQTSLIDGLTIWVLANAMRQYRIWLGTGLHLDMSVNLSVRNLQNQNLVQDVVDLARSSRFPLSRLTLEVTESAFMADPVRGRIMLHELQGTGLNLAMDDFGIGHSSLGYLKDLPLSRIKIDKSFVLGFADPRNASIVRLVVDLGHHLGMRVTAEGIENQDAFEALSAMGCDSGQGYYISRPLPADRLVSWMRSSAWGAMGA